MKIHVIIYNDLKKHVQWNYHFCNGSGQSTLTTLSEHMFKTWSNQENINIHISEDPIIYELIIKQLCNYERKKIHSRMTVNWK